VECLSKVQKPPAQNAAGISREVELISATRIPARHERIVKGQADKDTSGTDTKMALFNMDNDFAKDCGVDMEMALVGSPRVITMSPWCYVTMLIIRCSLRKDNCWDY